MISHLLGRSGPSASVRSGPIPVRRCLGLALLLGGLAGGPLHGEKLVVVRATAQPEYLRARALPDGSPRAEGYVFFPGRFFPGESQDASLEKIPFADVARSLAPHLAKQSYLPARSLAQADLLLVVHWGATPRVEQSFELDSSVIENLNTAGERMEAAAQFEAEQLDAGNLLPSVLSERPGLDQQISNEIVNLRAGQVDTGIRSENSAKLLGIEPALVREEGNLVFSERYRALLEMTREERYFFIVQAYDARELLRSGKLRKCWTLRASIRSAGVNFPIALERAGAVAARYFGQAEPDLVLDRKDIPAGRVRLDEIRILEPAPPAK